MQRTLACPFFQRAFGWSVPIGGLAGLIGLGGGEFRLPVLMHGIGFDAKSAAPLNLMISLVTLSSAMISRSAAVSTGAMLPHWPEFAGLALGGMASAIYGVRLVRNLSSEWLVRLIACNRRRHRDCQQRSRCCWWRVADSDTDLCLWSRHPNCGLGEYPHLARHRVNGLVALLAIERYPTRQRHTADCVCDERGIHHRLNARRARCGLCAETETVPKSAGCC